MRDGEDRERRKEREAGEWGCLRSLFLVKIKPDAKDKPASEQERPNSESVEPSRLYVRGAVRPERTLWREHRYGQTLHPPRAPTRRDGGCLGGMPTSPSSGHQSAGSLREQDAGAGGPP